MNQQSAIPGWARVLLLILPYFFVVGIFQLVGLALTGASFTDPDAAMTSEQQLAVNFFGMIGTFLILWIFMKGVDKEKFVCLGFQTKGRMKDFLAGTGIGLATMIFGFLLLLSIDEIDYSGLVYNPKELGYSVILFLIVAFVEEALFRGYVLKNFMLSTNKYVALALSSALFAIMHGMNPNISLFSLFDLFLAGMILGITYIYTKKLWYPIGLHFGWNLFQTHFGFNVSGQDFYSLLEFNYTTGNILNGGEFGFEGSIFSIAAQVVIFLAALFYYKKPEKRSAEISFQEV